MASNNKAKAGQAAMEYMMLTGFTLIILSILLVAAYTRIAASEKEMDINAAERAANELKRAADFVYIHGHPTKLTINVYMPADLEPTASYMSNDTINLAMRVGNSYTDVWRRTRGDVQGDLPSREGQYTFVVESTEDGAVHISA